jgi:acyl-CoA thioesterase-1
MKKQLLKIFTIVICFLMTANIAFAANSVVLVLGDSLSAAYGLPENSGWVHLLRARLSTHNQPYDVVNASISGDTTRGGLARINNALKQFSPEIVIIELGGNDALQGLPLKSSFNNLDMIVNNIKKAGAKPLIVGVEIPPNYGPTYTKRFVKILRDVANKHAIPLVPSIFEGFGYKRELFQPDGIHPIASAQPLMMETVWKGLEPMLKKSFTSPSTQEKL